MARKDETMTWQVDWDVASLEEVLEQDVDYQTMVDEARDGVECLAYQDDEHGDVDGWFEAAAQAGDLATCRMIELIRDNGDDPQDIYDRAFEAAREAIQ